MDNPEMTLIGKLDIGLSKGICLILGALKTGFIWLSGLALIVWLPFIVFEYGDGLVDLSSLEWIFMILMGLLIWRHVRYCKHFGTGFWRGLSRLLICQGLLMTFELVVIGFVASMLVGVKPLDTATNNLREFLQFLMMDDPASKILTFTLILFATYLAPPSGYKLQHAKAATQPVQRDHQPVPEPSTPSPESSL